MTAPARWAFGLGLTAVATLAIAAGSRAPWRAHPAADGLVRVSLSARPDRIETCRTLSPQELAEVPAHMRQAVECEGIAARYRLTVDVAGQPLADVTLTGGGAREDRPIHTLQEFPLPAGRHHLSVRWTRTDSTPPDHADDDPPENRQGSGLSRERGDRESEERNRRRREAVPARLSLDTMVDVLPRRVILVTYDPVRRRLLAVASTRDP